MSGSSTRRSISQTSLSSPRTLRRLRSTVRQVHFSNSSRNKKNLNDKNKSINSQQRLTTNENELITTNDLIDKNMTPSNIIDTLSLSDQEFNNITVAESITNNKSPSISDSEDEDEDLTDTTKLTITNSKKKELSIHNEVLAFFELSEDRTIYKCKLCQSNIKRQGRSTTNLRRHLGNVHGKTEFLYDSQHKKYEDKTPNISIELKEKLDEQLINAIIIDSRPFGDFARPGMKLFLATAIPNYKPLHRTTIRQRLDSSYKKHRRALRNVLKNVSHIALTTDTWKNNRNRHFISVTGHFYDKNLKLISITLGFRVIRGRHFAYRLKKFIKHEINFYKIENKIRSITTDNAPNMVNAIYDLHIGTHNSCMAHNLHLVVKSTVLPLKKKSSSSNTAEQPVTNDFDSQSESSTDDDTSAEDCSTSEEQKEEEGNTSIEEDDNESETSNYQSSSDEDEISLSSNDDQIYKITRNNVLTDPTLVQIRLLIKRVRELVGLVHQSSNLNEYVRQQKKERGLDGDGLILDCDIRWNSCYMMIDRFITYQPIIESITILHRNIISGLSSPVVQHLKRMILTEDEWDHLIATKNVLKIIYKAYKLLAGRRYQTLSIAYMVTRGLRNSLLKTSSSPQAYIENIIKKYLLHAFEYHFDQKLSVDQKQAMLIAAYLDPHTYRRMPDIDKNIAEKLIVDKLNENTSREQNIDDSLTNPVQQGSIDPLDDFLIECGLTDIASTITSTHRKRSTKEEIAFYVDRVKEKKSFEQFWTSYKNELPGMMDLVRSYNIRPATSMASEGLFSISNYVQRKHRSSLAPKTLKCTMVLRDQQILAELLHSVK